MQHVHSQATWLDRSSYPFQSHFWETEEGRLHYIDEGAGQPILFVHGTPVWSFVYRHLIAAFSQTHRCIAVDHLGFGLSDHPEACDYRPQAHARRLKGLIEKLDLRDFILVVHDFGGPIGLGAALEMPARVARIVIMNTWLWQTEDDPNAIRVNRLLNGWIGRFMYLQLNASARFLIPAAFADKKKLTKQIHHHYRKVFPSPGSRKGALEIGKSLLDASAWYGSLGRQLGALHHASSLILWGEKDPFIQMDALAKWQNLLPNAE
ncbi:MAG: alpha/beta fold hydrolase, partial [Bacteroidota bacterium]